MKYITSHATFSELLKSWAGSSNLIIAKFFFYYLGTELQKSQEGLIRALLHQILTAAPHLSSKLLPELWEEVWHTEGDLKLSPASHTELWIAFERLGRLSDQGLKLAIFIDGLDEYMGKPAEGVAMIQHLVANPRIKVMVSSRPIQPCFQAWSGKPSLKLHDLTFKDISIYIDQTIGSHHYMATIESQDALKAEEIRTALVDKAEGVFLWVVLACRSVSEGLDNFDRIFDIQQRILELPPQLEALFIHMLSRIEARYRESAAKILLLCQESLSSGYSSQLPALGLATIHESDFELDHDFLSGAGLNSTSAYTQPELEYHKQYKRSKCEALEGRIRSICCGLVELRYTSGRDESCFCEMHPNHDELIDSSVDFLHRTVVDYLNEGGSSELQAMIKSKKPFNRNSVLASLWLVLIPQVNSTRTVSLVAEVLAQLQHLPLDEQHREAKPVLSFLQDSLVVCSPMAYRRISDEDLSNITSLQFGLPYCLAVELGWARLLRQIEALSSSQSKGLRQYGLKWALDSGFLPQDRPRGPSISHLLNRGARLPKDMLKRPCWSDGLIQQTFLIDIHTKQAHLVSGLLRNTKDQGDKATIVEGIRTSLQTCSERKSHPHVVSLLAAHGFSEGIIEERSLKRPREEQDAQKKNAAVIWPNEPHAFSRRRLNS
jgi:hypothetical protein